MYCNTVQPTEASWLFKHRRVTVTFTHVSSPIQITEAAVKAHKPWRRENGLHDGRLTDMSVQVCHSTLNLAPWLHKMSDQLYIVYVLLMRKPLKLDLLLFFSWVFSTNGNKYVCCSCKIHLSQSVCGFIPCLLLHWNILAAFRSSLEGKISGISERSSLQQRFFWWSFSRTAAELNSISNFSN